ncbi:MAG TPA: hypothetical protein DC049_14440, partial [Spirochaetia bacterium]|nr:hypothetical protein [Spirochaetia bacterium]
MEFEIGSSINKQFFLGATSLDNSPRGFNGFIEYLTIDSPYTDAEKPFAKTIIKKKSFSFVAGRDDIADTFITKSEYQDVVTEQGIKSIAFTQDGSRSLQIKDFNLYLEKGFSIKIKFKPDNKQGNPYPRLIEQPGTYLLNYMYEQKMIKFIIYDADKKYIDAAVKFVPDNAFHDIEAVYQPGQNFISIKLDEQNPCVVPLDNLNVVFKENAPVIIGADKLGESQRAYCGLIANVSIAILKENELKTDLRLKATKSVKNKQGEIPIEKVIVENACAWPKLIKMKNGHTLVAIYNKPNHGTSEGDIECWISKNEGDTWEKSGIAAPHETNGNRIHCAIGNAANGEVVIVSSGYTSNYPRGIKGEPFRFFEKAWICRSKDYGLTWTQDKISFPELATPYGHIFYGSDNNMYLAANKYFTDGLHSYIYQSSDNGLSWKKFSSLNDKDTHDE